MGKMLVFCGFVMVGGWCSAADDVPASGWIPRDEDRDAIVTVYEDRLLVVLIAEMVAERQRRTREQKQRARDSQQEWIAGVKCPSPDALNADELGLVRLRTDDRWTVISVPSDHEVLIRSPGLEGERVWIDTTVPHTATTDGEFVFSGLLRPLAAKRYGTVSGTNDRVLSGRVIPTEEFDAIWRARLKRPDWPEVRDRIVAEARREAAKAVRRR